MKTFKGRSEKCITFMTCKFPTTLQQLYLYIWQIWNHNYFPNKPTVQDIRCPNFLIFTQKGMIKCGRRIPALANPSGELVESWLIYTQFRQDSLSNLMKLPSFWASLTKQFTLLSQFASEAMWMPDMYICRCRTKLRTVQIFIKIKAGELTDDNT